MKEQTPINQVVFHGCNLQDNLQFISNVVRKYHSKEMDEQAKDFKPNMDSLTQVVNLFKFLKDPDDPILKDAFSNWIEKSSEYHIENTIYLRMIPFYNKFIVTFPDYK